MGIEGWECCAAGAVWAVGRKPECAGRSRRGVLRCVLASPSQPWGSMGGIGLRHLALRLDELQAPTMWTYYSRRMRSDGDHISFIEVRDRFIIPVQAYGGWVPVLDTGDVLIDTLLAIP
jgi:hypothetical protein